MILAFLLALALLANALLTSPPISLVDFAGAALLFIVAVQMATAKAE